MLQDSVHVQSQYSPCALEDLGAFVREGVFLVGVGVHEVLLGEHAVCEVIVLTEQELESETLHGREASHFSYGTQRREQSKQDESVKCCVQRLVFVGPH